MPQVGDQVELNVNVALRSVIQGALTLGFMYYLNWRLATLAFGTQPQPNPPCLLTCSAAAALLRTPTPPNARRSFRACLAASPQSARSRAS